ncbi:hypothetical protein WJX75_001530 [Coccomyxa subellipsoidea]|uniref:Uncharacterized protein n=1 Tax=Coccomyxa subellipsoidea TaxID=248742 RepID=A0ABR2Z2D7_9CHLO
MCISAAAQQKLGSGKLVTKTEIPAFIPRQDLMDQLIRWATSEADEPRGLGMWGLPVKVDPYYKDEDTLWGITFTIMRDGEVATQLGVWYDDEEVTKHEWVGRGTDGFPTLEGKQRGVTGKHLEIRHLDENEVDDQLRETIRNICQQLVSAINKYYAFGSVFVDEAT